MDESLTYAMLVNPTAGNTNVDQKRALLSTPCDILNAKLFGLDTQSENEFQACSIELANQYDVVVVAGGDGTFSNIINSIDTRQNPIAYLPMGSGNAIRSALKFRGSLSDLANRIKLAPFREFDLIDCNHKKRAFMVSVGIEGITIRIRNQYRKQSKTGFIIYLRSFLQAYFNQFKRLNGDLVIDGNSEKFENVLSLMVMKEPYYGYRMKMIPKAKFDDRKLHILKISSGLMKTMWVVITAFAWENKVGEYYSGQKVKISVEQPVILQIDGDEGWTDTSFEFSILQKALKIKC